MKYWIRNTAVLCNCFVGLLIYLDKTDFWKMDARLDRDGCWELKTKTCRRDEINAQQLCDGHWIDECIELGGMWHTQSRKCYSNDLKPMPLPSKD